MPKALGMYLNMNLSDTAIFNGVRIAQPEEDLAYLRHKPKCFFRRVLSAKNSQLCRARAESSKVFDLEPLHASPTCSFLQRINIAFLTTFYHVVTIYNRPQYPALFKPCTLLASFSTVLEYRLIASKEDNAKASASALLGPNSQHATYSPFQRRYPLIVAHPYPR